VIDRPIRDLLDGVIDDEPPLPDAAVAVFGLADKLRKRRRRRVLIGATCVVVTVALTGNALTEWLLPAVVPQVTGDRQPSPTPGASGGPGVQGSGVQGSGAALRSASGAPSGAIGAGASAAPDVSASSAATTDPVLGRVVAALGNRGFAFQRTEQGEGWRRYAVLVGGTPTGTLETVVYATTAGLCLPKDAATTGTPESCVRMARKDGLRYYTYEDADDGVTEAVLVRQSDSRAYAVQATGGSGQGAPLTVTELKRVALDPNLLDAFSPDEWCDRPDSSCPDLAVPVPAEQD
jgi:hypothetical protein